MCTMAAAMAGGSLAIGAAGAVSKYSAQAQDAASMKAYNNQQDLAAEIDRNMKFNQLSLRQQQETDAESQALFDNELRGIKARGTADASAADSGVSGNSIEAVARDFYMQQGRIDAASQENTAMKINQLQADKDSAESEYLSRTQHAPIRQPSMLGLGLDIAGAGVQAYDLYKRYTDPPTK